MQINTAVQKLSSLFGNTNSDWVEVSFSGWFDAEEEAKLFRTLKAAVIGKQRIGFSYHGSGGSLYRVAEPMKLCFKGQS